MYGGRNPSDPPLDPRMMLIILKISIILAYAHACVKDGSSVKVQHAVRRARKTINAI